VTVNSIVMYSGGICSWATVDRLLETIPKKDMKLVYCDTKCEDEDLYRFIDESVESFGVELVTLEDGRDIWQIYKDVRYMGNSRIDPCSRILKRELADKWVSENYEPDECVVSLGIDWSESHRIERLAPRKLPYVYNAPMCKAPYVTKADMLAKCRESGVKPPKLYEMGFLHNNCGGFCIRSGQAQFAKLWKEKPDYYLYCEGKEQEVFEEIGKEQPFLRVTENGKIRYISLQDFRLEYLAKSDAQIDLFDWGGCGCFIDQVGA
jgi:hypothetical protein